MKSEVWCYRNSDVTDTFMITDEVKITWVWFRLSSSVFIRRPSLSCSVSLNRPGSHLPTVLFLNQMKQYSTCLSSPRLRRSDAHNNNNNNLCSFSNRSDLSVRFSEPSYMCLTVLPSVLWPSVFMRNMNKSSSRAVLSHTLLVKLIAGWLMLNHTLFSSTKLELINVELSLTKSSLNWWTLSTSEHVCKWTCNTNLPWLHFTKATHTQAAFRWNTSLSLNFTIKGWRHKFIESCH